MKKTLSKAEWTVMAALWEKPNQSLSGIIRTMGDKTGWKYNTYATYLKRMCEKGLVGFEQLGRDKFYYALLKQEDCIVGESHSLLEKMDNRATKDFLLCMIKASSLDARDRDELRALLDKLDKEGE